MKTGIYHIKNIINGKVYPGSAVNIEKRWGRHKRLLHENRHHCSHLQSAWNKYGKDNFEFFVLEECLKKELLIREQVQLDAVRIRNLDGTLGEIDHNLAYNTYPIAGSPLGTRHSEETKKKLSERNKIKCIGEGNGFFGRHHSEETKKKISESQRGEKNHNFGKDLSGEKHPIAKLTWEMVREIRKRYAAGGITQKQLAVEYGVGRGCIQRVVENKN